MKLYEKGIIISAFTLPKILFVMFLIKIIVIPSPVSITFLLMFLTEKVLNNKIKEVSK